MKNQKKTMFALVALTLALGILAGAYFALRPQAVQGGKSLTVEVIHADGSSKVFSYDTDKEYLGDLLLSEGLISGEQGQFGLYIHNVDGESAVYDEDKAYWALYEGEEYAAQGIDMTPIQDGDQFKLVYTRD